MKTHTKNFKEKIKLQGRQLDSVISYTIDGEEVELGNEVLNSISPHFQSDILKSAMKQIEIDSNIDIPVGTKINYKFGVYTNNDYEYIDYGNYIIYSSERQEDTDSYLITAYDVMLYAMTPYEGIKNGKFPMTISDYLNNICKDLNIKYGNATKTFTNFEKVIYSDIYKDQGYTYRDVLDEIAQTTGGTICINKNDELEVRYIKDNFETEYTTGNPIEIEDAGNYELQSISIEGKSYQETRNGKNLLDLSSLTTKTINGVTFTPIFEGKDLQYINVNGTATARAFYDLGEGTLKSGTYRTTGCPSGGSNNSYAIYNTKNSSNDIGNGQVCPANYKLQIFIENGYTANNLKFKPMISSDTTLTYNDYEPYGASPSPDYPSEVKTVKGVSNLLQLNNNNVTEVKTLNPDHTIVYDNNKTTFKVNSLPQNSSQAGYYYEFNTKIGQKYYVKTNWVNTTNTPIANIRIYSDNNGTNQLVGNMTTGTTYSFVATTIKTYFRVWITNVVGEGYIENAIISEESTNYVPYGTWLEYSTRTEIVNKNVAWSIGTLSGSTGLPSGANNRLRTEFFEVQPNTEYVLTKEKDYQYYIFEYKANDDFIQRIPGDWNKNFEYKFTTSNDTHKLKLLIANYNSTALTLEDKDKANVLISTKETKALIDMNKPNLFDKDNTKINDNWFIYGDGQIGYAVDTKNKLIQIPIKGGKTYTVSKDVTNRFRISTSQKDITEFSQTTKNTVSATKILDNGSLSIITSLSTDNYLYVNGSTDDNEYIKMINSLKVYEGTNPTPYYEICQIGDIKDTFVDGILKKRIGKVVLDGTQDIPLASGTPRRFNATYTALGITNAKNGTTATDTQANYRMCDHFSFTSGQTTWGNYYLHNNWLVLLDSESKIASANDLKTWLSNNPVTIYYVLENEETYTLPYEKMTLYDGYNYITNNDELEPSMGISYVNGYETIDEEYLKDVNVTFGEKYGPINSIVLSRAEESDNIYLKDEQSILLNGLCELKIKDNQIMNYDDRDTYLRDLFARLNGLEYYINDFSSTGITYLDMCDRYHININNNIYDCVLFNDEVNITQGLEELIYTEMPEKSETDYTKADKTDRKLTKTSLIVDKQQNTIDAVVEQTIDPSNPESTTNKVASLSVRVGELEGKITEVTDITTSDESTEAVIKVDGINASEPITLKIHPIGQSISYLYPRNNLFPSNTQYMPNRVVEFWNKKTGEDWLYEIPDDLLYYDADTYDEWEQTYDPQSSVIHKRCGYDANGNVIKLAKPEDKAVPYIKIELTDGNYDIGIRGYARGYIQGRFMASNIYTTQFYTKVETEAKIKATSDNINLGVDQKLSNYSTTQQMNSAIDIKANQITSGVSETYATKDTTNILSSQMKQKASSIDVSTTDGGTTAGINIKIRNEDGTIIDSKDANITMSGLVKFNDLSNAGSTTINGANIITGTITSNQIATNTINANNISGWAITGEKIATNAIDATKLQANSITSDKINANAITSEKIASNAITADKISAGAITASKVSSDIITTINFSAQKINADNITSGNISASTIKGGTLSGSSINIGSGNFQVTTAGKMTSKSGSIGGWNISGSSLYSTDSAGSSVEMRPSKLYVITSDRNVYQPTWTAIANVAQRYYGSSDKRLKNNIVELDDKYEEFYNNLKPVSFKYNEEVEDTNKLHFGFIAQDIEQDRKNNDIEDLAMLDKINDYYTLTKEEIISLNTWQIQKLKKENEEIKKELEDIKKLLNERNDK